MKLVRGFEEVLPIISINITDACNFNCSYCIGYHNNINKSKFIKISTLMLFLKKHIRRPVNIQLVGGEPTLHPKLNKIVEILVHNNYINQIALITNLTAPLHSYNFNNSKVFIVASYHGKNFFKFILKYYKIKTRKIISLNTVKLKLVENVVALFDKHNINYFINPIHDCNGVPLDSIAKKHSKILYMFDWNLKYKTHGNILDDNFEILRLNTKDIKCKPLNFLLDIDGTFMNDCFKHIKNIDDNIVVTCPYKNCKCLELCWYPKYE